MSTTSPTSSAVLRLMDTEVFRSIQIKAMLDLFSRALGVRPPRCPQHAADALRTFAQFTAACANAATQDGQGDGEPLRSALYREAFACGQTLGNLPILRSLDRFQLIRAFYRNIGIALHGALEDELSMAPCYFAAFYGPAECKFMAAFDQGFIEGIAGRRGLAFTARLTEGAPRCCASFCGAAMSAEAATDMNDLDA